MSKSSSDLADAAARLVRGRRVVVALSGGHDSIALLHLLVRGRADVRAAHVDHGLRANSREDASFCAAVAANLGIPYASTRIDVARGNSTQGRARVQRYAALVRLATELGGDLLAVAHHADDAWESSELQRERGAGAIGVAGPMVWSRWDGFEVVRPLLDVRRSEIGIAAKDLDLCWREDPSNQDRSYARTRVRASSTFDGSTLSERRDDALELSAAAILAPRSTGPTSTSYARTALRELPPQPQGRVLLDAARELHGELPGSLTDEIVSAVCDEDDHPRWYCGRRVAVTITAEAVTLIATRGQGTRLLEARATPAIPLTTTGPVPWFGHALQIEQRHLGKMLRGPRRGDRIGGESATAHLAGLGVPIESRWCWPCAFDADGQGVALVRPE